MAVFVPVLCGEQLGSKRNALGPWGLIGQQTSQAWQGIGDVLGLGGNDEQREKDQPQGSPHPAKLRGDLWAYQCARRQSAHFDT